MGTTKDIVESIRGTKYRDLPLSVVAKIIIDNHADLSRQVT